jgi:hypothetical protein
MLIWFILWIFSKGESATQNCLVLESTNFYGEPRSTFDPNSCFDVQVAYLKEMTIHVQLSVGFTFTFNDGTSKKFMESSNFSKSFSIDLSTNDIIGANIYAEDGINCIQFQLFDWNSNKVSLSEMMGQSSGCFSYFNSSFMKIKYLKIDSIQGCIDNKESNYFPFLLFSFS